MRQPLMLSLCAFLFWEHALVGRATAEPTTQTDQIVSPSKDIVDCAPPVYNVGEPPSPNAPPEKDKENVCLGKLKGFVFRSGNVLKLRTDEGMLTLHDNDNPENCGQSFCSTYKIIGYRPDQRIYIVRVTYSEAENDIIIKLDDGRKEELEAPLHFSSDGKIALSVANSDKEMTTDYDIKIIDLNDLIVTFSYYNHDVWRFIAWPKPTEIDLKTIEGNARATPYTARLLFSEGVWRLKTSR